ncbi:MAG: hypothetical protein MJK12_03920 [Colwellia sp.]|nr:hypothetical protein [Colwellia sp.]
MKHLLCLSISMCFYLASIAQSYAQTITIHTDNLADLYALKSKNIDNNLSVATNLLALNIPSANFQFEYMTTKRSLKLMAISKNICVVNKVKTKNRIEKYLFSQPVNLFLSRRLYQHTSYPALASEESINNSVRLSDIFIKRPTAKVIISGQISYGDILDAQIAKLAEANILTRHSSEHDKGVIAMFSKGRAEFALLYPHQVFGSDVKITARSYAISSVPAYILGHLMCTKNEVSKTFIDNVNNHLSAQTSLDSLLEIHLNYIDPIDKVMMESYFRHAFY